MNINEPFEVSIADVIHFEESKPLSLSKTIKFVEFKESLEKVAFRSDIDKSLLDKGIECELLRPGVEGWKKGRLRVRIEFIPETAESSSELDGLGGKD